MLKRNKLRVINSETDIFFNAINFIFQLFIIAMNNMNNNYNNAHAYIHRKL